MTSPDASQHAAASSSIHARKLCEAAIDEWIRATGFQLASRGEFVAAAAVVVAARSATGATDSDGWFYATVLQALTKACGRVERRKAPYLRQVDGAAIYWGVTCESMPAAALAAPARPLTRSSKKCAKAARRAAQGKAPADPERFRVMPPERGVVPHFTRYMDELLSLHCAPRVLELGLFPNAKELTESFACFNAVRRHLCDNFRPDDPSVRLVAIGDGLTPRTAALFAFRTSWRCVSVDPLMARPEHWCREVDRLTAVRAKVEDVADHLVGERLLLVLPHAHVALSTCVSLCQWKKALGAVVIPCCNWYKSAEGCGRPLHEADDLGVVSPHRSVRCWSWAHDQQHFPLAVPLPALSQGESKAECRVSASW